MKTFSPGITVGLTAAFAITSAASAQSVFDEQPYGWFFRAGPAVRFNIDAQLEVTPSPVLAPRVYDNGYVLPDIGGQSGRTWNWGYQSSTQIEGDELRFDRMDDAPPYGGASDDLPPAFGGEIIAGYRMMAFNLLKKRAHLGLELGYGYAVTSQDLDASNSGTARWTTDRYGLGGTIPPAAPYRGNRFGPGPLIDLPRSSQEVIISPAVSTLTSSLDLDLHTFRFGPVLELDLTPRLGLALGIGYSSVYADADLQITETMQFANPAFPIYPAQVTKDDLQRGDWRPGFYTELRVSYQFNPMVGAFVGGDFQYNSNLEFHDSSHRMEIGLEGTYAAKAGVILSF